MPGRKRTNVQRQADLPIIAQRYLRGETQRQIGDSLGLSNQQISHDMTRIRAEWRQDAIRDTGTHQSEQLAKLDLLEVELWAAWRRSLQPLESTTVDEDEADVTIRSGHAGAGRLPAHRTRKRTSTRVEQQHGNVAYLVAIERVIAQRCKILGLFAPAAVTVDGKMTFNDLYNMAQDAPQRPELRLLSPDPSGDDDEGDADAL